MKKIILATLIILSIVPIIAEDNLEIKLEEGINNITINREFETLYASELIEIYPSIKSISVSEYGITYGYVNALGGIGLNILIEPETEYEIYTTKNITINLR